MTLKSLVSKGTSGYEVSVANTGSPLIGVWSPCRTIQALSVASLGRLAHVCCAHLRCRDVSYPVGTNRRNGHIFLYPSLDSTKLATVVLECLSFSHVNTARASFGSSCCSVALSNVCFCPFLVLYGRVWSLTGLSPRDLGQ
jgi:hypothetical protein